MAQKKKPAAKKTTKAVRSPAPAAGMSEGEFWRIIGLFNWKKLGDDDAVIRPAVKELAKKPVEDIFGFDDILAEKLFQLDGEKYAREIGEVSYTGEDEFFSVDEFLYVRACVVANGKACFDSVLANPTDMPKEGDFEPLIYVGQQAYELKTGQKYKHITKPSWERSATRRGGLRRGKSGNADRRRFTSSAGS